MDMSNLLDDCYFTNFKGVEVFVCKWGENIMQFNCNGGGRVATFKLRRWTIDEKIERLKKKVQTFPACKFLLDL
jgi:hypothetical protein